MSNREQAQEAVNILSDLILRNGRELGSEQHRPGADADASDGRMAECARVVKELRAIRERIESLIIGAIE